MTLARTLTVSILILLIIPISAASAIDYYVSPVGSDSNDGSVESPWATIQHAVDNSGPGDNVHLRKGTYDEKNIYIDGRTGDGGSGGVWWAMASYPSEKAVIRNSIWIYSAEYVRIEGINLLNARSRYNGRIVMETRAGNAPNERVHHIYIAGNVFEGAQAAYGFITINADDVIIENNEIRTTGAGGGKLDHGIYLAAGNNITIRANDIRGVSNFGIHVYNQEHRNYPRGYDYSIKNVTIENNCVRDNGNGIIVSKGGNLDTLDVTIRHNSVTSNKNYGVYIRGYSGKGIVRGVNVLDNSIQSNGNAEVYMRGSVRDVLIASNILSDTTGGYHIQIVGGPSGVSAVRNSYYPGKSRNIGIDDRAPLVADEGVISAVGCNLSLGPDAGAIGGGVNSSSLKLDSAGAIRLRDVRKCSGDCNPQSK